jgi:2-polyprenyl-6-methoxyphenol hydroxylase-like FAD-dependent oxidoreductase
VELTKVTTDSNKAEISLKHADNREENEKYDYVFASDGAHSIIRKQLGLRFDGSVVNRTFHLCDAHLSTKLDPRVANIFLYKDNLVFMANIKDDLWRLVSFSEHPEQLVGEFSKIGNIHWKSKFIANHRIIEKYSHGRVFFGGDAAHVHSPLGGRGMNLGIEDAYVFAELLQSGRLDEYNERRLTIARELIPRIEKLTNMAAQQGLLAKYFRRIVPFVMPRLYNSAKDNLNKFLLGLDHEI